MTTTIRAAIERLHLPVPHRSAAALAGAYYALGSAGLLGASASWLVALLLSTAILFVVCVATTAHHRGSLTTTSVVVWAVLFRTPFLFNDPVLSDDVWRYLWDGRVALSGVNPYSYAPDDPVLASLRDDIWMRVNHRSIPTIYPPFAQLLFRLAASTGGLTAWKLLVTCFDFATIAGLAAGLGKGPAARVRLILYAWNPLVVVEFSWSGHVDAAAVALSTWAIVAARKRSDLVATALMSIATGIKLYPALLLPALLRRANTRAAWAISAAVAVAGFAPYISSGVPAWFAGLASYAREWEFNGLPYLALRALGVQPAWVRVILATGLVVAALVIARGRRAPEDVAVGTLGVCVALSPTVHPWYVTWPLAAATLSARPPRVAVLVASLAVLGSYVVLVGREATGVWRLPVQWLIVEWGLVLAAFGLECWIDRRRPAGRARTGSRDSLQPHSADPGGATGRDETGCAV